MLEIPSPGDVIRHRTPYPGEPSFLLLEIGPDTRTNNRTLLKCARPCSDDPATGWTESAQEWMALEAFLVYYEVIGHANLETALETTTGAKWTHIQ